MNFQVDKKGFYGNFGGAYIPEMLYPNVEELRSSYIDIIGDADIRYSSRTRLNTDVFRHGQALRRAAHRLVEKLPKNLKNDPDAVALRAQCCNAAVTIVHLIHRRKNYFTQSKDFEFSRTSIEDHWQSGLADVHQTLHHQDWKMRKKPTVDVTVFDLAGDTAK